MKLKKSQLKRIIKEELESLLKEAAYQPSRKVGTRGTEVRWSPDDPYRLSRPGGHGGFGLGYAGETEYSRKERHKDWDMAPGEEKRWTDEGPVELDPWTELDKKVEDMRRAGVKDEDVVARLAGTYEPPPGPAPEEKLEWLAGVHEMNPEANYRFWGPDHPHIQQIEDYLAQTDRALPGSQSQFPFGAKHQTPVKRRREQGLAVKKQ